MKTFSVTGKVTISCYTIVKAESEAAARKIAEERKMQRVDSAQRHGESPGEVWCHSGELDGVPEIIEVDEEEAEP